MHVYVVHTHTHTICLSRVFHAYEPTFCISLKHKLSTFTCTYIHAYTHIVTPRTIKENHLNKVLIFHLTLSRYCSTFMLPLPLQLANEFAKLLSSWKLLHIYSSVTLTDTSLIHIIHALGGGRGAGCDMQFIRGTNIYFCMVLFDRVRALRTIDLNVSSSIRLHGIRALQYYY